MCCFARARSVAALHVSATRIFSRATENGRQVLAYSMNVAASGAIAMILPLPVPPRSLDGAVRFIALDEYPELFTTLSAAFPEPMVFAQAARSAPAPAPLARQKLEVHKVGRFEASFVPTLADFSRLDERFRIPDDVWQKVPAYADYGFAVFKLTDVGGLLGRLNETTKKTIHPMAFEFPRRDPTSLFFPTFHIHDNEIHAEAVFDHQIYFQAQGHLDHPFDPRSFLFHQATPLPAGQIVDLGRAHGLFDAALPIRRMTLQGSYENRDFILSPPVAEAA
jgi:hypothetical protein